MTLDRILILATLLLAFFSRPIELLWDKVLHRKFSLKSKPFSIFRIFVQYLMPAGIILINTIYSPLDKLFVITTSFNFLLIGASLFVNLMQFVISNSGLEKLDKILNLHTDYISITYKNLRRLLKLLALNGNPKLKELFEEVEKDHRERELEYQIKRAWEDFKKEMKEKDI